MSQLVIDEVAKLSIVELETRVARGEVMVCDDVLPHNVVLPALPAGWVLKHTQPKKEGQTCRVFIAACCWRTKRIWNKGQITKAISCGLSKTHAIAWNRSRCKIKYELLPTLAEVINSQKTEAYMEYSVYNTKAYHAWLEKHDITNDNLTHHMRLELKKLLMDVLGTPS